MKFMKSSLAQKLIIILIALMVFNIAVPQQVQAADLMGILFKPLYMAVLGIVVSVDVTLGVFLCGLNSTTKAVGSLVDLILDEKSGKDFLNSQSDVLGMIFIGPDTIFSGDVDMLNANIFDYVEDVETPDYGGETVLQSLGKFGLQSAVGSSKRGAYAQAVSKLYIILRNTCALIMLAGLIYTGIRILLSANVPTKKGQYLTILQDWLIGLVLLVFSHLIMILVFKMSDALTDALRLSINGMGGMNYMLVQTCAGSFTASEQALSLYMLIYLIWLTIIFAFSYMKRFFWVCLLIVMAPVFSTLYAFGQQTKSMYSRWLKEYMSVVLIQPYHMLVYSVLVGIPMGLSESISFSVINYTGGIYALGAMTMIRPAEKYLRNLFGMDQGIASVASYESGKQTFDAIKKVVATVAKVVVAAAATVATSGAAAPLLGKVAAGGLLKGAAGKMVGGMLAKGGGAKGVGKALDVASNVVSNMPSKDSGPQTDVAGAKKDPAGLLPAGNTSGNTDNDFDVKGRRKGFMSFGAGAVSDAYGAFMGDKSFFDLGDKYLKGHPFMGIYGKFGAKKDARINSMLNSDDPKVREKGEKLKADREAAQALGQLGTMIGREFESQGGFKELYKGFNEIRDTMFVNGAPGDWKGTAGQMDERYKGKLDSKKYDFVHNEENKQSIIANMNLVEKAMQKYPDDASKRTDWIDSKAKEELQKIADSYVPLGVSRFDDAYQIRQIEKQTGATPLQAYQKYANSRTNEQGFQLFNTNTINISQANNQTNSNNSTVSDSLPNARKMWDNGYRNVQDMSNAQMIMDKLNTSLDKAMQMEQALRKKGSVNYTGTDKKVAEAFKEINEHFEKMKKDKK